MTAVQRPEADSKSGSADPSENASVMQGVEVVRTTLNQRQWLLRSSEVEIADTSHGSLRFVGPELTLTGQQTTVRSPYGHYDMADGAIVMSEGATMTGRGYNVRAQNMNLDADTGIISSSDRVTIDGEWGIITGHGMQAASGQVRILRDVKTIFY